MQQLGPNRFKAALRGPRPLVGMWSMLDSVTGVEVVAGSGYDWILLDGEHSTLEVQHAIDHLRALAASTTIPILRLPTTDPVLFKRVLDAGATTIMVPHVESASEARAAVDAMHYPPAGARDVDLTHRARDHGRTPKYLEAASQSLCLIVQVETPAGMEQLAQIASVQGVDAVFFGPGDLAASMGFIGQPDHPNVQAAVAKGLERAQRLGVPAGVLAPSPTAGQRYLELGFSFVSVGNDLAMLVQTADANAARFRMAAAACNNRFARQ